MANSATSHSSYTCGSSSPSQHHVFVTQSQISSTASPLRRPHIQAPPTLLTTSLINNAHQNHGLGLTTQTPLSTTTLSSPFAINQSPHSLSPSMAVRGPVTPSVFASTYNPQQWGRITDGLGESVVMSPAVARQTVQYAPRMRGPDEPMASPPPPYTADPPSAESVSPAVFSHGATPLSASTTFSPDNAEQQWSPDSPYMQVASPIVGHSAQFAPPPAGQRVRSTSRNHAERFLDAINIRSRNNMPPQSAVEPSPHQTIQVFDQNVYPPNARRAVSASAVTSNSSRPSYGSPIQQDMVQAIPPPPPGPPPSGLRSQSVNRVTEISYSPQTLAPPRTRVPPGRGAALEPVPPTPANWVDEDAQASKSGWPQRHTPFHVDTSAEASSSAGPSSHIRRESAGLVRSPAVRNRSAQGLRERRSASQTGKRQNSGDSTDLSRPLQDIVTVGADSIANRRASARLTPKSAQFQGLDEALQSAGSGPLSPRVASGRTTPQSATFSPISPPPTVKRQESLHRRVISGRSSNNLNILSQNDRPVSHILHLPNEDDVNIPVMPLSPESINTPRIAGIDTQANFMAQAMDRYRIFLEKESSAQTDSDRLHLFIEHMISESQIRRERYAGVFESENLDPAELLEGAFEEPEHDAVDHHLAQLSTVAAVENSRPSSSSAQSYNESQSNTASRQPSSATSVDHPALVIDTSVQDNRRGNFVPCLSPIASMSAVTRDETESRGRAPSRWWESGSNPSTNGDGFKVLERTKRETKYMSAVIEAEPSPGFYPSSSSQLPSYGENEYPPEKPGLHDQSSHRDSYHSRNNDSYDTPYTPDPRKLDVSRLITLPPPYPRHHPAVNNSHPDLADIRGVVRILNDNTEIEKARQTYKSQFGETRARASSFQEKQQNSYNLAIQRRIDSGNMSQRDFDAAKASLASTLSTSRHELAKADFSLYESLVVTPLHTIYTTRISRASEALEALSSRLLSDTSTHSPNVPQEAGDEQPELLEKLTMLKWLFEARESLHRDLYALLSERNDRYKATVLLPLSAPTSDPEELQSAKQFFAEDLSSRRKQFSTAIYKRWTAFHSTIERHVTQGVEIILSAFWDIAPQLQALLNRIPNTSRELRSGRFDILIPRAEVEENPVYWDHPLRYLWSIVCHAESSTRQFVEGQVSLWCLLQEVREGVVRARGVADKCARDAEDDDDDEEDDEEDDNDKDDDHVTRAIDREIRSGVEDLKDKVAAVEGQWVEGLGGEIGRVKEGLRAFLEESGGWDDELEGFEE